MTTNNEPIITHELLKSWSPCTSGYRRYCELFPEGATLQQAIDGLVADNHDAWGLWLFERCRELKLYESLVSKGYRNSGDYNSGHYNSGHRNSGDYNSGDYNSGYFNSDTPSEIRVFNKPCLRSEWEKHQLPSFLEFSTTKWIADTEMTDQEKIDNPKFFVAGGYLKTTPYKQAFQEAYAAASEEDKALLLALPNFDADVFFEISGIRVDASRSGEIK